MNFKHGYYSLPKPLEDRTMQPDVKMALIRIEATSALGEELCEKLRENARENYAHSDGDIVIDDDAQCTESDEYGFWVEARVYVRAEDVGVKMDNNGAWSPTREDEESDHEPLSGIECCESIAPRV